jgi:hypothetical protein
VIEVINIGSKPPVFYYCVIDTTRNAYKEQLRWPCRCPSRANRENV